MAGADYDKATWAFPRLSALLSSTQTGARIHSCMHACSHSRNKITPPIAETYGRKNFPIVKLRKTLDGEIYNALDLSFISFLLFVTWGRKRTRFFHDMVQRTATVASLDSQISTGMKSKATLFEYRNLLITRVSTATEPIVFLRTFAFRASLRASSCFSRRLSVLSRRVAP